MIFLIIALTVLFIVIFVSFCIQNNSTHVSHYFFEVPNKILFEDIEIAPGDIVFYRSLVTNPTTLFLTQDALFDNIGIIDNDFSILTINGRTSFESILDYSGKVYISFCKKPTVIKYYKRQEERNHINRMLRTVHHHTKFSQKLNIEFIAEVLHLSNLMSEPYYNNSILIQKNILKSINNEQYSPPYQIII